MEVGTDCFVSGALAVVLRVSRFAGIAPLRFVKKKTGWRVSVSVRLSFYGYIFVTTVILLTCGTLIGDLLVEQEKSVRMRTNTRCVVFVTDACLMMLIAGTAVYGAPGQMRSLIACLNHVQKINYELNIHHWPTIMERKKICLFILWAVTTLTLTCVDHILLTVSMQNIDSNAWISMMYSFYYVCYWILQLYEMKLIMITLHVMYSFRAINDSLRNLLLDDFTKSTSQHEYIRRLTRVYASACDVVREVDRCHGLMVLLMLGSFLFHLVCTPYYLINNLFEDNISQSTAMHVVRVLLQLFWCFYHTINLVLVIEPCHLTHMEMEIARELVSHLMRCTHSVYDPLAVELELFFRHLILNQASYSPLKVTTLTRSLVATILGSITTYLVVIIQL